MSIRKELKEAVTKNAHLAAVGATSGGGYMGQSELYGLHVDLQLSHRCTTRCSELLSALDTAPLGIIAIAHLNITKRIDDER